ncbi:hypothetical protein [Candidatus Nitrosacidococcus tergens]|uniref:Uncharacterized protein n=1 Tax=Candidatus Nitrosacidococcus tergens TaxID=553981 RepID=A0A7G1QAQ3_9GAMM|nr:hypothetical protein [Candidatus Nitrosacidococcus tergens]CAB1276643.1 conserved membrane protein of unknown function [Candidatus Nitrosacidococcus tergens]
MDVNDSHRRPGNYNIGVIIVSIFLAIVSSASLMNYFFMLIGMQKSSAIEQQGMVDHILWQDISLTFVVNAFIFIAAMLLYLHRKKSLYFFLAALVATLIKISFTAIHEGSIAKVFSSTDIGGLVVSAVLILVCIYVWQLSRSNTLK